MPKMSDATLAELNCRLLQESSDYILSRVQPERDNDYTWFKDALLEKTCWLRVYWDQVDEVMPDDYKYLTA